jgi:hypothetical protein
MRITTLEGKERAGKQKNASRRVHHVLTVPTFFTIIFPIGKGQPWKATKPCHDRTHNSLHRKILRRDRLMLVDLSGESRYSGTIPEATIPEASSSYRMYMSAHQIYLVFTTVFRNNSRGNNSRGIKFLPYVHVGASDLLGIHNGDPGVV